MTERKIHKKLTLAVTMIMFVLLAYFVYVNRDKLGNVVMPFIIGALTAYILNPLVVQLQRKKLPRWLAIVLIYLMLIIVIAVSLCYFIPVLYSNISDLISNIPQYTQQYNERFNNFRASIDYSTLPSQVKEIIVSQIHTNISYLQDIFLAFLRNSLGAINKTFSLVINFILGMIIAFYILKDLDYFKMQVTSLVPRRWRGTTVSALGEINTLISGFIQGQLLIATVVGILEIIGLSLVGVDYAFLLGVIGGLANIIPYFGPFIGAVPAVVIALLDSPLKALLAALVFMLVQQIDNGLITPRVMSDKVGLHPLVIIFVVLLGGSFFGIAGLVLAVPATAIIKVIGSKIIEKIV